MRPLAPIVLFAYKRPQHTLAALQSLAANPEAPHCHLTIHCDGPKKPSEHEDVAAVRRLVHSRAWCGQVKVIEREVNMGLAQSISAGVSQLLLQSDRLIVLEDDLVLAPGFLRFMNDGLRHYQNDPKVMQVSGYMFPLPLPPSMQTCFLPMISSWGWATWARAWRFYDPGMTGYEALEQSRRRRRRFDLEGSYPFFDLLRDQRAGRLDSWGIRWYLSVFQQQGLTLFPAQSYVRNQGWDGSGTHCGADDFYDTLLSTRLIEQFPPASGVTKAAYRALQRYFRGRSLAPSLLRRVVTRLKHALAVLPGSNR